MNYKDYPWFYNLSNQNTIWDYIAFLPANFLYSLPQPLTSYAKGPLIASVIGSLQSDWDAPFMEVVTSYTMSSPPMDQCDHGLVCHPLKTNNNSFPTSTTIQTTTLLNIQLLFYYPTSHTQSLLSLLIT